MRIYCFRRHSCSVHMALDRYDTENAIPVHLSKYDSYWGPVYNE